MFETDRIQGAEVAPTPTVLSDDELVGRADDAWHSIGRAHRELLDLLREVARRETWRDDGAQDLTHWVSMRYGLSAWKAQRWVAAAEALASLPLVTQALETGVLGIDRAVELTRFATPETERDLVLWAARRSSGAIRHRGDLERRRERHETRSAETERFLRMGYSDDGMRFELDAELPADQGAVVERALSRWRSRSPTGPTTSMTDPGEPRSRSAEPTRWSSCAPGASPQTPTTIGPRWWCTHRWTPCSGVPTLPTPRSRTGRCSPRSPPSAWRATPACRSRSMTPRVAR